MYHHQNIIYIFFNSMRKADVTQWTSLLLRSSSMSCAHINSTVYVSANLESPLDSKEIKPIHPKRNQP